MLGSRGFRVAQKICASRAPYASSIRPWTPQTSTSRTPQGPFLSNIAPTRCRTSLTASNAISPIRETRLARWARQFLPPGGSTNAFELLTRLSQGINHGFLYRRREAKGIQQPVETLQLGHGSCRDFAMLMIEVGARVRFRRAVCVRISRCSVRRAGGAREWLNWWVDPCLGANLFAGHRLDRFRPHARQRRHDRSCHRCGRARSSSCDPAPRHLSSDFLRTISPWRCKCASRPMRQSRPMRFPNVPRADNSVDLFDRRPGVDSYILEREGHSGRE